MSRPANAGIIFRQSAMSSALQSCAPACVTQCSLACSLTHSLICSCHRWIHLRAGGHGEEWSEGCGGMAECMSHWLARPLRESSRRGRILVWRHGHRAVQLVAAQVCRLLTATAVFVLQLQLAITADGEHMQAGVTLQVRRPAMTTDATSSRGCHCLMRCPDSCTNVEPVMEVVDSGGRRCQQPRRQAVNRVTTSKTCACFGVVHPPLAAASESRSPAHACACHCQAPGREKAVAD